LLQGNQKVPGFRVEKKLREAWSKIVKVRKKKRRESGEKERGEERRMWCVRLKL